MIAPMALETYEQTRPWARAIARVVADGRMPPWSADPQHKGTFEGERYLTEAEKKTLATWAGSGTPAGAPSSAPSAAANREESAVAASDWQFGRPDLVVRFSKPVTWVMTWPTGSRRSSCR
jgi:hypothetical protein